MTARLNKLLDLAGPALGPGPRAELPAFGRLGAKLLDVLRRLDGFYAFESALHVFPAGPGEHSLLAWNDPELWRSGYEDMAAGHLFFAEDAFGGQFSLKGEAIYSFDPETGASTPVATTLEDWAAYVLDDWEVVTGYPLAHDWQMLHGPLRPGERLVPKRPFVFGGDFTLDNLWSMPAADSMRYRASIAKQLRDLPDGQTVRLLTDDGPVVGC